jgi:hypothetical protein
MSSALKKLDQFIELATNNFGVLYLTPEQLREIFSFMNDCDVDFSKMKIKIENLCIVLYNAIQNIDNKNTLFGDELVCVIRKIIDHFMEKDASREIALLFELIFKSLSPENLKVFVDVDEALIQFVIKFMKSKRGGASIISKYYHIAMCISIACPMWESTFIEHMNIEQIKKMVSNESNDCETMLAIYHWISQISGQACGIAFILQEPAYFTKILCELVKNAVEPEFFQSAIISLENLLRLKNPVIQEMARSELSGCVPNMTKHDFSQGLREKWECVQKMF